MNAKEKSLLHDRIFRSKENPEEWAFTADDLRRAAQILFEAERESHYPDGEPKNPEDERMDTPATMLYGYAMENAIKGLLIKKHGSMKAAMAASGSAWGSHRLVNLGKLTGIQMSRDVELLLGTLEAFVRWAGKYPISLKRPEFTVPKQYCSGDDITPNELNYTATEILDDFLRLLTDEILKEFRATWKL